MSKQSSDLPHSIRRIFFPQEQNQAPTNRDDPEFEQFLREVSEEMHFGMRLQCKYPLHVVNDIIRIKREVQLAAFNKKEK